VIDAMKSEDTLKVLAANGAEAAAPATPQEFRTTFERNYAESDKLIRQPTSSCNWMIDMQLEEARRSTRSHNTGITR
jgi:hypothetical protein